MSKTRPINDLAVAVGEYRCSKTGQDKKRWQTIGTEFETEDGGRFLLLDPLINLAAIPRGVGKDRIMVSKFASENRQNGQGQQAAAQGYSPQDDGYYGYDMPPAQPAPQEQQWVHPGGRPMTPAEVQAYKQQQAQAAARR